jgi:hypothetical protein
LAQCGRRAINLRKAAESTSIAKMKYEASRRLDLFSARIVLSSSVPPKVNKFTKFLTKGIGYIILETRETIIVSQENKR